MIRANLDPHWPAGEDPRRKADHFTAAGAVEVLELLAAAKMVEFDVTVAQGAVHQAIRDVPGRWPEVWEDRLRQAARDVGLRMESLQRPLREGLRWARPQAPVVLCSGNPETNQPAELILVLRSRLGWSEILRFPLEASEPEQQGCRREAVWIRNRKLARLMGVKSVSQNICWAVGVPMAPCAGMSPATPSPSPSTQETQKPARMSPFSRLMGLLQPERKDIITVLTFAGTSGVLLLAIPIAVEALVNFVAFGYLVTPVIVLAVMLSVFLGLSAAMRGLQTYVVEIIQRRLFVRMTADLTYRLPRVQLRAYDSHHGPELVNRFFDVLTIQKGFAGLLLDAVSLVLSAVLSMMVLAFYHPYLLGFDLVLMAVVAGIVFGLGRGATKSAIRESGVKYAVAAWLEELAHNPLSCKSEAASEQALRRSDALTREYVYARQAHFAVVFRQILAALGLQVFAQTVLLGLGGWLVIQEQLTIGQLVASELLVGVVVGSFAKMGKHMETYYDVLAAVDKLGKLIDLPLERTGGESGHRLKVTSPQPASISANNLSFSFPGGPPVIRGFTETVAPGERVALVGPSGSGKSTLLDLLVGLRMPSTGVIDFDGEDFRDLPLDDLRAEVALVRDLEVLGGTILENVRMGREHLTLGDVRKALARVGLLEEVSRLPEGLYTELSIGGRPLARGEVRRLMLARAIVGGPRLLILDEALDNIDRAHRAQVFQTIFDPHASWTLIVVTQNDEVQDRCERVITIAPTQPPAIGQRPSAALPGPVNVGQLNHG